MSTALAPMRQSSGVPWALLKEQAGIALRSGMLPQHIKTEQAAIYIAMKGQELNIPLTYALSNIAVINGKPVCQAELMAALIYRDHGGNALTYKETSNERCTISYARSDSKAREEYTFTIQDASKAGLTGGNWAKYPAAMLRARCVSAVARMKFADSIAGMYTPEEMGAAVVVTTEGEVVLDERPKLVATAEELSGKAQRAGAQIGQVVQAVSQQEALDIVSISGDQAERASLAGALKEAVSRANAAGATWKLPALKRIVRAGFDKDIAKLSDLTEQELVTLTNMVEGYLIFDEETSAFIETAATEADDDDKEEGGEAVENFNDYLMAEGKY